MTSIAEQLEKANRLSAITKQVGFALWQIQELENVSAQYFVLLAKAKKGMGQTEGENLVQKAQSKTFGSTIHEITKAGLISSTLETRFTKILAERNWLVHRSRMDNRNAIHSDKIALALISRLETMATEATDLLKEIAQLSQKFVLQHGVSEEYINEMSAQLLAQWSSTDEL